MKRLLIAVLVISLGWFGYWFVGSLGLQRSYEAWFDQQRAAGWQAEYSELHLRGFPNRFDTTFEDIALADPHTGLAWEAPFFQLFALSYRPNHIIAIWPQEQFVSTPAQKITIHSETLQASAVFAPSSDVTLRRSNFATDQIIVQSDQDWRVAADQARLAFMQDETSETTYTFALQGIGVAPPAALRNEVLPEKMSSLDLSLRLNFDRPWDLRALEQRRPQPTAIDIDVAKAAWGPMEFEAAGAVTLQDGFLQSGELTFRAAEWEAMLDLLRTTGQIADVALDTAAQVLSVLASTSGTPKDIDVTLTFKEGVTYLGFIPLGPAPRIYLQ